MSWPPGPAGSGQASWNGGPVNPALPRAVRSEAAAGPQKAAPETGGRLTSATPSPAPAARSVTPSVAAGATSSIATLVPFGLQTRAQRWVVPPQDLPTVLERAVQLGLRQLWIGRHLAKHLKLPDQVGETPAPHPWLGAAIRAGWEAEPAGLAPWIELRRRSGDHLDRVELAFPCWDPDGNPFAGAQTPGELLWALQLFERELRLRYRWSPGTTGLALMRAVHSGPGGVKLPELGTPAPPAVEQRGALDSWASRSWIAAGDDWPALGWIHAYDLNGMYLAACSAAELGFGEAVHHKPRGGIPAGAFGGAGYWRATVRTRRQDPLLPLKVDGRAYWYTTEAIAYLAELGLRPRISEAWIYPQRRRWLEPWYARLRDARTALAGERSPAGVLALRAVKRVYTAALGRLAASWLDAGEATFRPDWRHAVIDRARINMHRHLVRAGRRPLAISEDLAVWPATDASPGAAAAELGLEVSEQLGKWKPAGAITAGQAALLMVDAGQTPAKRLRALLAALEAPGGPV